MRTDTTVVAAPRGRLALLLLLAPALIWLLGLIVLPHIDLAVLSLRTRVAPRIYEWSFDKYRTFVDEPLYWHTFVRTALGPNAGPGLDLVRLGETTDRRELVMVRSRA